MREKCVDLHKSAKKVDSIGIANFFSLEDEVYFAPNANTTLTKIFCSGFGTKRRMVII